MTARSQNSPTVHNEQFVAIWKHKHEVEINKKKNGFVKNNQVQKKNMFIFTMISPYLQFLKLGRISNIVKHYIQQP